MSKLKNKNLIVIEGLDGSGKKTQTKLLVDALNNIGKKAVGINFPKYDSNSASLIKQHLNEGIGDDNVYAVSSLFALDRYFNFTVNLDEKYKDFNFIVADRYTTSNAIYQGAKVISERRREYLRWLFNYEYEKLKNPEPNLVMFLDMPFGVSQKLLLERYNGEESKKDMYEKNTEHLLACKKLSCTLSIKYKWKVVPCFDFKNNHLLAPKQVGLKVLKVVKDYFRL